MRKCLVWAVALLFAGVAALQAQERREKPEGDKPSKPEFKPPFGRGFGPFRPPASREEAIQRTRQQLEFARNMVRQLEEQLKRLEAGEKPAVGSERKPEARREGEARKPDKPEGRREGEARKPGPPGKPEARRPGPPDKPRFGAFGRRFGHHRGPWARGPQGWPRWGAWPRFGPWWPQAPRMAGPGWGWPRWGWGPRFGPPVPPRFAPPRQPAKPGADRSRDLESRLERLARELEQLRRELRERR